MSRRGKAHGFTLIELLVVMTIIGLLAGLLLGGISAAKRYMTIASCRQDISQMMIGLTAYNNDFSDYPPGGAYLSGDDSTGQLDPNGNYGAGILPANPSSPLATELELRTITVQMAAEKDSSGNPTRYVGPWYQPNRSNYWDSKSGSPTAGAMLDRWSTPYRYLADGRRTTMDKNTGLRMLGRVNSHIPVIWSLGPDLKQEPTGKTTGNDNIDNNGDGKVDDSSEVGDDICSWNSN